jgi:shikimate dehydrogenase
MSTSQEHTILGNTKLYGIFGNPIGHSLSPTIQNAAFRLTNQNGVYIPLQCEAKDLEQAVASIRTFDIRGVNVTAPYKEQVIPFLDRLSPISQKMGVVNTLYWEDDQLMGTTTDPTGFLEGFKKQGHSFTDKNVAILGSGGTARTVAFALTTEEKVKNIYLVARNKKKQEAIQKEIQDVNHFNIQLLNFAEYIDMFENCDVVINATTVGMPPSTDSPLPAKNISSNQIVYDLIYSPAKTPFIQEAQKAGAQYVGGLGMLIYQGMASFNIWTGQEPSDKDVATLFTVAQQILDTRNG